MKMTKIALTLSLIFNLGGLAEAQNSDVSIVIDFNSASSIDQLEKKYFLENFTFSRVDNELLFTAPNNELRLACVKDEIFDFTKNNYYASVYVNGMGANGTGGLYLGRVAVEFNTTTGKFTIWDTHLAATI